MLSSWQSVALIILFSFSSLASASLPKEIIFKSKDRDFFKVTQEQRHPADPARFTISPIVSEESPAECADNTNTEEAVLLCRRLPSSRIRNWITHIYQRLPQRVRECFGGGEAGESLESEVDNSPPTPLEVFDHFAESLRRYIIHFRIADSGDLNIEFTGSGDIPNLRISGSDFSLSSLSPDPDELERIVMGIIIMIETIPILSTHMTEEQLILSHRSIDVLNVPITFVSDPSIDRTIRVSEVV